MMKNLQSLMACLMAAVMCLMFTGCSKDDPAVEPKINLVGTWEHSYDGGYDLYQFNANGTGKGVSSYGETWTFSYSLNAETMKLVYTKEKESAKVWNIEFISNSSIEVDGEWILSKTNKKIEDVKVPSLTGTWRYDYSNSSYYVYMYFDGKGTGWQQEFAGGNSEKNYFEYAYSTSEKKLIFTYGDGYREEMKVLTHSDSELKLQDSMDGKTTIWKFVSKEEVETGGSETKRLAQMMEEDYESNGGLYTNIYNFDYDSKGRVVSVTEYQDDEYDSQIEEYIHTIEYSENSIICTRRNSVSEVDNVVTFKLSDGKVIFGLEEFSNFSYSHSYSYNSNYLTETGNTTFTWSGNKLMKSYEYTEDDEDEYIFEYDGKTCKGYNSAIVLFFAHEIIYEADILPLIANPELIGFKTNHLPKSAKCGDEIVHFTYELNDDGYLRKCKIWENDGPSYEAYTFNWE